MNIILMNLLLTASQLSTPEFFGFLALAVATFIFGCFFFVDPKPPRRP
jgi:hypothetical protein